MPSGAKKRKAAKKKKHGGASSTANPATTTTHPHGDEELKRQEDKESDGGDVSSPTSQDPHNHQHHEFTDGEEEEADKGQNGKDPSEGAKGTAAEEHGEFQVEKVYEPEDESDSKNVRIEQVESPRKSHDGSSSSSSSQSSSDDESSGAKKNNTVIIDRAPIVESIKQPDSFSGGVTLVSDGVPVAQACQSVVEASPADEPEKVSLVEEKDQVDTLASLGDSSTFNSIDPGLKDSGDEKVDLLYESSEAPAAVEYLRLGFKMEFEAINKEDETDLLVSDAMTSAVQETEEKLLVSYNAPKADASNGAEHEKTSEVYECSDRQPLVPVTPLSAQKTSWKGCCGLFEVFSGSSR